MSFEIDIRVDPSQARPAIQGVTADLAKAEAAGPRAGAAITTGMREGAAAATATRSALGSLGEALGRVGNYQRILAGETARARTAVGNLATGFAQLGDRIRGIALQNVGRSFAGLTAQLQREQAVLERIHGPAREYAADLRSLEMLHKRGAISAREYQAEVARMGSAMSGAGAAKSGGLGAAAGKLGLAVGGAAVAREVLSLGNTYQELQNRLRTVATGQDNLNQLMERTRAIANGTRLEWAATTEGFVRMFNATKELGLSQSQVLTLTDRLNKAITLSGASSAEASAGLVQLSQGLASGALRGDELRSVLEQLPAVADVIAKGMGVTRGQLRQLGADGKITTQVIIDAFNKAGAEIDENFGKTVPTLSQQWTVFKNELTASAGSLLENSRAVDILGQVLRSVLSVLGPVAQGVGAVVGVVTDLAGVVKDAGAAVGLDLNIGLGTFAGMIVGGPVGAALGTLAEGLVKSIGLFDDLTPAIARAKRELMESTPAGRAYLATLDNLGKSVKTLGDDIINSIRKVHQATNGQGAFAAMMNGIGGGQRAIGSFFYDPWGDSMFDKGIKALGLDKKKKTSGGGRHQMTSSELDTERVLAEITGVAGDATGIAGRLRSGESDLRAAMAEVSQIAKEHERDLERQRKAQERINKLARDYLLHQDEIHKKWQEFALASDDVSARVSAAWERVNEGALKNLKQSVVSLGDAFVDWIFDAEFTWSKFFEQMSQDMLRLGARGLLQFGLNAAGIPGGANGGSWTVGGSGGTDSQIAMLRVTPREQISVHTPGQMEQGDRSGGGGQRRVVHEMPDGRRSTYVLEDDVEELVLRVLDRNEPMLRSRLTGK